MKLLERDNSLTFQQIVDKTKSSWETINKNVLLLKELKLVNEKIENKSRMIFLAIPNIEKNTDTLYGLPLSKDILNKSRCIFQAVSDVWKDKENYNIRPTRLQKASVRVVEKMNLPIPIAWYRFGKILPVFPQTIVCQDSEDYKEIREVAEIVYLEDKDKTVLALELEQYKEKPLYAFSLKLRRKLERTTWSKKEKEEIKDILYQLMFTIRFDKKFDEYANVASEFAQMFIEILKESQRVLDDNQEIILDTYKDVWDLVSMIEFYNSLQKYCSTEILDKHLSWPFKVEKGNATESLKRFSELLPTVKEVNSPLRKYKGRAKLQNH